MNTNSIPGQVEIDGTLYRPHVEMRYGRPSFTGRWLKLVRPTPIAYSINFHFNRVEIPALAASVPHRDLPAQLRKALHP